MSKIVQVAGGIQTQQNQYTGPERELTVDISNWDLRIHDGVTPGGHMVPNRDNNDERYQAKSTELDGLTAFLPEQRGFLARLGPSDYRLRSLEVNFNQLTISNPQGYAGNPVIGIAETIQTDHIWNGQHIFNDVVQFTAGINADLAGSTTGTHTGPVVGDVTGNLSGDSNGTHTGQQIGNVDVRGALLQLDNNQIPLSALNGLLAYILANAIPAGSIILWSGSVASIPAGWLLCDGFNGTPNLLDKFIVGAGGAYAVGAEGGSVTHNHAITVSGSGIHDHGISAAGVALTTAQIPSHSHHVCSMQEGSTRLNIIPESPVAYRGTYGGDNEYTFNIGGGTNWGGPSESVGGGSTHTHAINVSGNGSHTHTGASANTNGLPPYFALCYLMKQ